MSVSAASLLSPSAYAWLRQEFQLANTESSNASRSASSAQTSAPSSSQPTHGGASWSGATLGNDFLTFLTDVQSGNLQGAQAALSTVQNDLGSNSQNAGSATAPSQAHHHRHHHSEGGDNATASSGIPTTSADPSGGVSILTGRSATSA